VLFGLRLRPFHDKLNTLPNGWLRAQQGDLVGVLDHSSKDILPMLLEVVNWLPEAQGLLLLRRQSRIAYYHSRRQTYVWREEYFGQ
jgi:hypothetical protein